MKKTIVALVACIASILAIEGYAQMGMMGGRGMMGMSSARHQYVMHNGIGSGYASKVNPLKSTTGNIHAGEKLYGQFCAGCHGIAGLGNGEAGKHLNPPPPNIAALSKMPMATDGYLFWTIAEGGVPVQSPMPAFKGMLKEDQIWQIILYLRVM